MSILIDLALSLSFFISAHVCVRVRVCACVCVCVCVCCTVPRGAEVGLDAVGFTQDNLTARRQSSTLRSHRLVYFVARVRKEAGPNFELSLSGNVVVLCYYLSCIAVICAKSVRVWVGSMLLFQYLSSVMKELN